MFAWLEIKWLNHLSIKPLEVSMGFEPMILLLRYSKRKCNYLCSSQYWGGSRLLSINSNSSLLRELKVFIITPHVLQRIAPLPPLNFIIAFSLSVISLIFLFIWIKVLTTQLIPQGLSRARWKGYYLYTPVEPPYTSLYLRYSFYTLLYVPHLLGDWELNPFCCILSDDFTKISGFQ